MTNTQYSLCTRKESSAETLLYRSAGHNLFSHATIKQKSDHC